MRAYHDAQTRYAYLAEVGELLFQLVAHVLCVGHAVRLKDVHLKPLCLNTGQIALCAVDDRVQRRLAPAHLLRHVQRAAVRHVQHRLYRQHPADQRRRVGHAPSGLEVVQVVHGEAVGDLKLVRLAPCYHLVIAHAVLHARHHAADEQAEAAGYAQRVHHVKLTLRKLASRHLRAELCLLEGDGHLLRHVQKDHVLPLLQQRFEKVIVRVFVYHRGFQSVALPHPGIDGGAALLTAVVLIQLVADGVCIAYKGNIVRFKIGPRQV